MTNNPGARAVSQLIVRAGHAITLPAAIHQHSNVIIEYGAQVNVIHNSSGWFALVSNGDMEIAGRIEYRHALTQEGAVSVRLDTGEVYSHTYPKPARGGRGGDGAPTGGNVGGQGAEGTASHGGGGGGGAAFKHGGRGEGSPGRGQFGGYRYSSSTARGGRGGKAKRFGAGGLVLLFARGKLTFKRGYSVDLRGENGNNGTSGSDGLSRSIYDYAACGGGGGGPAGAGGHLLAVAKEFEFPGNGALFAVVYGGLGGMGGNPGRTSEYAAQWGMRGENGVSGSVNQILL